ncbi:MAG: hypothetical protein ABSF56_02475 [Minisyncoccia bacterium]|jgi:hypothetical protein
MKKLFLFFKEYPPLVFLYLGVVVLAVLAGVVIYKGSRGQLNPVSYGKVVAVDNNVVGNSFIMIRYLDCDKDGKTSFPTGDEVSVRLHSMSTYAPLSAVIKVGDVVRIDRRWTATQEAADKSARDAAAFYAAFQQLGYP